MTTTRRQEINQRVEAINKEIKASNRLLTLYPEYSLHPFNLKDCINNLYSELVDLEDELETLPVETTTTAPNPNRSAKSNLALSLLWVATFFYSLNEQFAKLDCRTDGLNYTYFALNSARKSFYRAIA